MPYTVMKKRKNTDDGWSYAIEGLMANKESSTTIMDHIKHDQEHSMYDLEVVRFRIEGSEMILEWGES